ncbi:hypothetical protein [Phocaeicola paurosaccharolyticus]|uniref:hypothetical protein n=1 Tax=Phocaeicola paurosaccharolyticus TaxID=732242 RepID=UPI00046A0651|nr:hypothetical protein [Phocaeicola paurosaccharolyticus]
MKKTILFIALGMLILGGIISIYFIINTYLDGYWIWGSYTKYDVTGQFGDFFGGAIGTFFCISRNSFGCINF